MTGNSRAVNIGVAVVVALAVVVYAVTDSLAVANICYFGVMVGAGVGAWMGAERAPAGLRVVPRLIAVGIITTVMAEALFAVLEWQGAETDVTAADPLWFSSYAFLCAALLIVVGRTRAGRVDLDFVLDVVTIVTVSVLVFWSLSIDTIMGYQDVSPFVRAVWAGYPLADAVLLALVVRVLTIRGSRAAFGSSFALGVCLWLFADVMFLRAPEGNVLATAMEAAWMVALVLLARAAWRVRDIEVEEDGPRPRSWMGPLTIAVGPLMVPPALELVADLRDQPDQPVQLFVGMSVLVAFAFVRTARLLRSEARAVRELEVARDAALEASRAKSMFLANMSHEIRTPLTTVLAAAEILEDTQLDAAQARLVGKMRNSGTLLMSLVEGVLDFSRVEAGHADLRSVEFDLHELMSDVAGAYAVRAGNAGLGFDRHLDPRVPRTVVGDPTRLLQVVNNLLDNALKFTGEGRVGFFVRRVEVDGAYAGVEFVVTDTGIGIRDEDQAAAFETFRQVDGSTTRRYGGSGLGLAICRELTERMGGSVALESQFGAGSTFTVRLPLASAPQGSSPSRELTAV